MVLMWRSEGNLKELILSFHHVTLSSHQPKLNEIFFNGKSFLGKGGKPLYFLNKAMLFFFQKNIILNSIVKDIFNIVS